MKYPNGVKKNNPDSKTLNKSASFARRGMSLETRINEANEYYLVHGIANIHKKPTPITIVDVDYQSRQTARIKEAYFVKASTTDYNGIYKGKYVDFDAKQTQNKKAMPLTIVHQHQIDHLRSVVQMGGIAFLVVEFSSLDEAYVLSAKNLLKFWDAAKKNDGPKSIPYEHFLNNETLINSKILPVFDYLSSIGSLLDE